MITTVFAGMTDVGRTRKRNEDSWTCDPEQGLYVVSDGMGGHAAGDVASKMVCDGLPSYLSKLVGADEDVDSDGFREGLIEAVAHVNREVKEISRAKAGISGMGATLVVVVVRHGKAMIAHMGDSRVYLLRRGELQQVTVDHSVIQVLIETGEVKPEDAASHPARGRITRCIGMGSDAQPEMRILDLEHGDRLMLCSDGLTSMVSDKDIERIMSAEAKPQDACKKLIAAANAAGGQDNITVVIIEARSAESETSVFGDSSGQSPKGARKDTGKDTGKDAGKDKAYAGPLSGIARFSTDEEHTGDTPVMDEEQPVAFVMNLDENASKFFQPVMPPEFTIGRDSKSGLIITEDMTISRRHCMIKVADEGLTLRDLGSRNGTYLNGKRIRDTVPLPVPSWLMIGRTRLAVIPTESGFDQDSLVDSAYSAEGSIIIPPSEFFEEQIEAMLVVDIIGSTKLVEQGETLFVKVVSAMGQILDRALKNEKQPFLKCTGDGFFACFGSADAALKAAVALHPGVNRLIKTPVRLSMGLHWGSVRFTADGDRTGRNAHAVFSVEQIRQKDNQIRDYVVAKGAKQLIVMTADFHARLDKSTQGKCVPVGAYKLKGLDEDMKVFMWLGM
jgi:protein phosphatase